MVEWTPEELAKRIPDLKGFDPAKNQETLPLILDHVGANVQAFFHNFISTASVEEIYQQRIGMEGGESLSPRKLNYLLLAVPASMGVTLQEYRTDSKGRPASPASGTGRGLLTHGFASVSVYFDPQHQSGSTFRYLGRKAENKRTFLLVGFAQRPEPKGIMARFNTGMESIPILVQGVAWIDPGSYQIVRMRTDLLAPQIEFDLEQLSTDISFHEVQFKGSSKMMWLPREVNVTVRYENTTFFNQHRYSDYRLFNVEAGSKTHSNPIRKER